MCTPTQPVDDVFAVPDAPAATPKPHWARLVSLSSSGVTHKITKTSVLIGRSPAPVCDVQLHSPKVSGKHCRIWREKLDSGGYIVFLQDLSSNGTYLNGMRMQKGNQMTLAHGNEIGIVQSEAEKISFLFQDFERERQEEVQGGPFHKYYVSDCLGSGAFAVVKLAVNKKTGEKFALKIIDKKKFSLNSSGKSTVMDEVNVLARIQHPNVIGIVEVFDTPQTLYIVLELVTGGELFEQIVSIGQYSEEKAFRMFIQMLRAVHYLHSQGIVHRDLKPENILLKSPTDDTIKISDFGLSRVVGEGSFMQTMCGTPQYLAPEILTNKGTTGYGNAVDLWSLGVILYILLCGYMPFDANKPGVSIFDQVKEGKIDLDGKAWSKVSANGKHLVLRLLTVDPALRITADDVFVHPWVTKYLNSSLNEPKKVAATSSASPMAGAAASTTMATSLASEDSWQGAVELQENAASKRRRVVPSDEDDDDMFVDRCDTQSASDGEKTPKQASSPRRHSPALVDTNLPPSKSSFAANAVVESVGAAGVYHTPSHTTSHAASISPPQYPRSAAVVGANGAADGGNRTVSGSFNSGASTDSFSSSTEQRRMCKYGSKCYRKNPEHFREFRHPHRDN